MTATLPDMGSTIIDAIEKNAAGAGVVTFLDNGHVLTWGELHELARRMATVLQHQGVRHGSRVVLSGETSLHTLAAIQAVWLCGAAVTVEPPAQTSRHERVVSGADLAALAVAAPAAEVWHPGPADLAVVQYTSGSTRTPSPVPVTHGHLTANLEAIKLATSHSSMHPGRMLSWLPLYHDMGLIGFLGLPLLCGCDLFLQSPATFAARPAGWFQAIAQHRITISGGPNFAFALMTRLMRTGMAADLSSLRLLLTGAEPIDAAVMGEFAALAAQRKLDPAVITPAYGLAEATLAVSIGRGLRIDSVDAHLLETQQIAAASHDEGARRLVKLGRPVPRMQVRIAEAPAGERGVGHVEVSGPSVVDSGWLRTGDLGYFADGELVICGRAKDVLFAAGRNIFPQDIEASTCEVPGVRPGGAVAFAVPGSLGDRLVVAVESVKTDPAVVKSAVAQAVLAEVGLTPAVVHTVPYGRLPRTSSGKLRRAETRRRYLEGSL